MEFDDVMHEIGKWAGTMRFFPSDPDARFGIAEDIAAMCGSKEQVEWLVGRLPKLYSDWPGTREARAVLCSKFPPADGIDGNSTVYVTGIPSDRPGPPRPTLPNYRSRELPPGAAGEILRDVIARSRKL